MNAQKINRLAADLLANNPIRASAAMDAVAVTVTLNVPNPLVAVLKVGGHIVHRDGQGKATLNLRPGTYTMEWRGYCAPHTNYVVAIEPAGGPTWTPSPPLKSDSEGYFGNQERFTL